MQLILDALPSRLARAALGNSRSRPSMDVESALRAIGTCHGYAEIIKDKQMDAISAFVSGKDVFVSLPTGYGTESFLLSIPSTAFRCPPKPRGSYFNSCSCNSIGSNYERSSGGADLWNVNFQVFLINAHQKSVTSCIPRRRDTVRALYTFVQTPSSLLAKGAGHEIETSID